MWRPLAVDCIQNVPGTRLPDRKEMNLSSIRDQSPSVLTYKPLFRSPAQQVSVVFTASKKCLFATNGGHYNHSKPQSIKMQSCGAQHLWMHLQNILSPKTQRTLWKGGGEFVRSRGSVCCETMSPSNVRSYKSINTTTQA